MMKRVSGCTMLMRFAQISTCLAMLVSPLFVQAAETEAPIVTDNRIKTFVYNENEVFKLVMHYGFQSHIVFDKNEVIETVSLGDSYAWKITPVENRIFVKPLEESSYTNMTVVTDKRTYQFDLVSKAPEENLEDGLVYMVRFYYPAGTFDMPYGTAANAANAANAQGGMMPPASPFPPNGMPGGMPPMSPMPPVTDNNMSGMSPMEPAPEPMMEPEPAPQSSFNDTQDDFPDYKGGGRPSVESSSSAPDMGNAYAAAPSSYNFDYTLTGPEAIAPARVFDDGLKTYFEFPASVPVPNISTVADSGSEAPVNHVRQDGFVVVDSVAKKFSLRSGSSTVYVYNERL